MKLKNYFIIFCLLMVLVGCAGAASAVSDDSINNGQSGVGTTDNPIPVTNNNQALGVGAVPASSAQGENNGGNSIQSSLADDNSSKLSGTGDVEYYVNVTGSDDNSGTQASPFATIGKAISVADSAKNVIVHIGEGTFTDEGNTDLEIALSNVASGGSITFIGVDGKTIIDGENLKPIFKSISANSIVTFKYITFINARSSVYTSGGAINNNGYLTVDNCVFENCRAFYASGGAIYTGGSGELTVTNSVFNNTYCDQNGGAILAEPWSGTSKVIIERNNFINCWNGNYNYGAAVYISCSGTSKVNENKFYNISSSGNKYDAGLYMRGQNGEIINNTFENCIFTGNAGGIMYVGGTMYLSGNKFINSTSPNGIIYSDNCNMNYLIEVDDVVTTSPTFTLTANVTDIDGNTICVNQWSRNFYFTIGGERLSQGTNIVNGTATLDVSKLLDNGDYVINATLNGASKSIFITGTLSVNINRDPIELWVDDTKGEDVETAGSQTTPFKSIKYAIEQALAKSIYITIHINNGIYSGENNTYLSINGVCTIDILGESKEGTIIDGEGLNQIFSLISSDTVATIKDISLINGKAVTGGAIRSEGDLTVDNCIFLNDSAISNNARGGAIIVNPSNSQSSCMLNVTNSEFINCTSDQFSAVVYFNAMEGLVNLENNSIINSSIKGVQQWNNARGVVEIYAKEITVLNNEFINITVGNTLTTDLYIYNYGHECIIDNNTFSNFFAPYASRGVLYIGGSSGSNSIVTNNKFSNEFPPAQRYEGIICTEGATLYSKNNTFTNTSNVGTAIIFESGSIANTKIVFLDNQTVTTNSHLFILTANVTDEDGNPISVTSLQEIYLHFYANGTEIGVANSIIDGVATFECSKFLDNGEYVIDGTIDLLDAKIIIPGTLIVNITVNPKEYYVSESGDDEDGDGSVSKPFKTLKRAFDQAYDVDKSYDVTIHVLEGTYSGEGNVNLYLDENCGGVLKIIGDNNNKVIFDGNGDSAMFWVMPEYDTDYAIPSTLKVSLENIKFINFAFNGWDGAFITSGSPELNLTNCIFDSFYFACEMFSVIHQPDGDLNIFNSTFSNITVSGSYLIGSWNPLGYTIINNSTFTNINVDYGCVISGVNELYNSEFMNCTTNGWTSEGFPIVYVKSTAILENNTFIDNVALSGIITIDDTAYIINNTFIGNEISFIAPIYARSDIYVKNSKFVNNTGNRAGAIYADASVHLIDDTFANNTQIGLLNDIYVGGGMVSGLTLKFNDINSNQYKNDIIAEIISDSGAIISGGGVEFYINDSYIGSATVTNGMAMITYKFPENGKFSVDGVYYGADDSLVIIPGEAIINVSPVEFTDLYVSDSKGSDENNGSIDSPFKTIKKAVYYADGHDNVTIHVLDGTYKDLQNTQIEIDTTNLNIVGEGIDKTIIDGEDVNYFFNILNGNLVIKNLTMINGYAPDAYSKFQITIRETSSLLLENVKYDNNTKTSVDNDEGIGILNYGALTIINSTFNNNNVGMNFGSDVIYSQYNSVLRIYNSTFSNNGGYGTIFIEGATTTIIENCNFTNHDAIHIIYSNGENPIKITACNFINNAANCMQGKVEVTDSKFIDNHYSSNNMGWNGIGIDGSGYVSDCIFINNTASGSGGAMYFTGGEIYNCEFYNNTAASMSEGAGGALVIGGETTIGNCYFEGNQALAGGGSGMTSGAGAIMNYGHLIVIDCTFVDNYAVHRGGAIRNGEGYDNAVLTVYSSKFINNYAGNNGGAITSYMDPSQYSVIGTIHIHSSEFINNTAGATGGAIEIFRTNADIDDCLFDGNYALNGGAISALSKTTITTSNFTNNNGFSGGAIRVQGNVEISKSVFENNTASTGGAIDSVGGTLSVVYSVFVDNTADALGDAIFEGSANTYITDLSNNWWGVNDNPNQFIYSNYTIDSWVVANLSPNLTEISVGEAVDFTVNFTDNSNNQLADSIPARVLCVGDAEYPLADNTAGFTVCADDAGFIVISVDNQVFDLEVVYPSVTNSTFFNFFDKEGYLRDNITADTLIFVGEFSNLGVDAIRINKAVDLIGDGAVLNDIGLVIIADDVTVDDFEINLSNESGAGAAIVVYGDDVCVENSLITVNSSEDDDSFAILVEDAEDFVLTNNIINYTGNSDGSAVNNAIRLEDADGAVIEDNVINISIPSVPVTYLPPDWDATVLSEGIVVDTSDDVVLSNNTINVDYNKVTGAYDSVYAVEFVDSDNAVITDNEITTNGNSYAYGLTLNGENFTVEGNNITTTGNNYANGIQINGPASGNVSDNNIDAEAPSVVYPVYSYGRNVVTYTDNNISGTSNSVYAMELFGTNETVKDNNIVANGNFTIGVASKSKNLVLENNTIIANGTNKGTPTAGDSIKSETIGVKAVAGSTAITNNTIISTGDSAVKTEASGYIANNTLVANDTTGDAAVDYTPNQGLIVDDNVPKMEKVFITADDIVMYYKNGTRYVITLSDGSGNLLANKPVTITINGVPYSRATNAQGTASVALNLVAGNYTASASFAGDENYGKASIENTVTILSTISADNLVKVHKNASQYYATFTDGQGNPLANTDVTFNINGVMYTRKTNENGTAKLNINLDQGTFVITATNPINGETHSNNITVLSRIVDNKDLVKYYKNASQYVVTLIGDDGNPVGAGETVTFNINGVFYTRTTNATGQAKLNINLDPGVFVITAEYKGCKVSNTVTVKPVLSASDLTKKYGTPDQFIATLVDGQGNPVDGEIVTFNINGVFYNRITRDGGQAKLNINLQPGEFIITSSYNGTSISNTVKVEA